jgi:hypothetical protein
VEATGTTISVSNVEVISRPITARAMVAWKPPPSPNPTTIRITVNARGGVRLEEQPHALDELLLFGDIPEPAFPRRLPAAPDSAY